jgi:hypothetical protein
MIKMVGTTQGNKPLLLLGLSRQNCEELLKGKPIAFNTKEETGLELELVLAIIAGETEDSLLADIQNYFDIPNIVRKD